MLDALAMITRLEIVISRPCAWSVPFYANVITKNESVNRSVRARVREREKEKRSRVEKCNHGCTINAVHRYSRYICGVFPITGNFKRQIAIMSLSAFIKWAYQMRVRKCVFQRIFYVRTFSKACIARARDRFDQSRIPVELRTVIIISHVTENRNGKSPTRIHFYDKHQVGRYYVKWRRNVCIRINSCPVIARLTIPAKQVISRGEYHTGSRFSRRSIYVRCDDVTHL